MVSFKGLSFRRGELMIDVLPSMLSFCLIINWLFFGPTEPFESMLASVLYMSASIIPLVSTIIYLIFHAVPSTPQTYFTFFSERTEIEIALHNFFRSIFCGASASIVAFRWSWIMVKADFDGLKPYDPTGHVAEGSATSWMVRFVFLVPILIFTFFSQSGCWIHAMKDSVSLDQVEAKTRTEEVKVETGKV